MVFSAGNSLSLIRAVLDLEGDRRTGVLDVMAEGVGTRIYFEDGKPLFAEDGAPGETFGRLLVRQGLISDDQLALVIAEMIRAATGDDPLRFGEAAVGLGVLTDEQVERGLVEHVSGIITRSLQREESQWAFHPSPAAAKPPRSLSLELDPALLESMRRSPDGSAAADAAAAGPDELVVVAAGARVPDETAAEQAFQKGVALLRAAQTASAAIELRRASELRPESPEYLLYATWAEARSRSDIPSEPDRDALLEIAQRAKRGAPTFAFGAYVIGQLSMWAGDDAAAKKWFYEALRLDPTSEAGTQVRILARRTGTSGLSGVWKLPDADPPAERAPLPVSAPPALATTLPVSAPPALATKGIQPSSAPPNRWAERLVPVAALLATAGFVTVLATRGSGPRAGMAPGALPQPAASVGAGLPVALEPQGPSPPPDGPGGVALASDPDPERKSLGSMREKALDDGEKGTVLLPSRASGHRIFVDGRRAETDGVAPLHLLCGPHVVQIGGHGTPEHIDLPCRGEIQLE